MVNSLFKEINSKGPSFENNNASNYKEYSGKIYKSLVQAYDTCENPQLKNELLELIKIQGFFDFFYMRTDSEDDIYVREFRQKFTDRFLPLANQQYENFNLQKNEHPVVFATKILDLL